MISKRQFASLRRGDVVLWGDRKIPRVVQIGPADYVDPYPYAVYFAKMIHVGHENAATVYFYHDVRHKIAPTGKRLRRAGLRRDLERAESIGFEAFRDARRVFRQHKKLSKLKSLCRRFP